MIGLLFELLVIAPIRVPVNESPIFLLYQDWALGLIFLKIWTRLVSDYVLHIFVVSSNVLILYDVLPDWLNFHISLFLYDRFCDVLTKFITLIMFLLCHLPTNPNVSKSKNVYAFHLPGH